MFHLGCPRAEARISESESGFVLLVMIKRDQNGARSQHHKDLLLAFGSSSPCFVAGGKPCIKRTLQRKLYCIFHLLSFLYSVDPML